MAGLQQGYKVPRAPDQDYGGQPQDGSRPGRGCGDWRMPDAMLGRPVDKIVAVGTAAAVAYLIATPPLALPCHCPGGTERRTER
jgi:hypothetical protein